jgi:hypothetical protein
MANPTPFALKLAKVAQDQHTKFFQKNEADPELCGQIKKYWEAVGVPFTSCTTVPWSAVFVSFCVKQAGATATEFQFSPSHSVFVHKAIQNMLNNTGVFRGFDIASHAPSIGDIIQNNRSGGTVNFAFATANSQYSSHSAIVVQTGQDSSGKFALTIGGNESDSIRGTKVRLNNNGFIIQRANNPYISIIKNLK